MQTNAVAGLRQLMQEMDVRGEAAPRLLLYLALLQRWNAHVNLTASVSWGALRPLFHEALWAAGFYDSEAARHLDIGSGAGFPAVPFAALYPGVDFELVESRSRRAVFLEVAARELGLKRVRVIDRRLGEYVAENPGAGRWDCVSWKAVKLARKDAGLLLDRAPGASFWLFHASELPVEDGPEWARKTSLYRQAAFPGKRGWSLSMFHVKHQAGNEGCFT